MRGAGRDAGRRPRARAPANRGVCAGRVGHKRAFLEHAHMHRPRAPRPVLERPGSFLGKEPHARAQRLSRAADPEARGERLVRRCPHGTRVGRGCGMPRKIPTRCGSTCLRPTLYRTVGLCAHATQRVRATEGMHARRRNCCRRWPSCRTSSCSRWTATGWTVPSR